jgi:hypothetical protein
MYPRLVLASMCNTLHHKRKAFLLRIVAQTTKNFLSIAYLSGTFIAHILLSRFEVIPLEPRRIRVARERNLCWRREKPRRCLGNGHVTGSVN